MAKELTLFEKKVYTVVKKIPAGEIRSGFKKAITGAGKCFRKQKKN
ncbi:MAG: hypothetical protein Q8N76_07720 [Candidatus Omnitrophota bacterium]|nr:hypothetical protein [Candidatus Omnitrophota bacterium]